MDVTYEVEMAKRFTGITDETTLDFLIEGVISKIERIIGYKLARAEITEFIQGIDTNNRLS